MSELQSNWTKVLSVQIWLAIENNPMHWRQATIKRPDEVVVVVEEEEVRKLQSTHFTPMTSGQVRCFRQRHRIWLSDGGNSMDQHTV